MQGGLPAGRIIKRARTRQPEGYTASSSSSRRTTRHYCVHHNYVYYPTSWTDSRTGTHYQSGYYDENGQFYEDVAFKRNGRYYNVLCACDYCGTQVKKDLSGEGDQTLVCQQCGAPLRIVSALDEYTQDPDYTRAMESSGKKPGRGAYVCKSAECFEKARKARRFERSLSCKIPEEVYEQMSAELQNI